MKSVVSGTIATLMMGARGPVGEQVVVGAVGLRALSDRIKAQRQ